jgi:hypothetical protein
VQTAADLFDVFSKLIRTYALASWLFEWSVFFPWFIVHTRVRVVLWILHPILLSVPSINLIWFWSGVVMTSWCSCRDTVQLIAAAGWSDRWRSWWLISVRDLDFDSCIAETADCFSWRVVFFIRRLGHANFEIVGSDERTRNSCRPVLQIGDVYALLFL